MDCYLGEERVWVVPGWGGRAQSPMLGYLFRSGLRNVASHLGGGERVYGPPVSPPRTPAGQTEPGGGLSGRPEGLGQSKTRHGQTWGVWWLGPHGSMLSVHHLLELLRGCVTPPEIKRGTHSWLLREPPHPQAANPGLRVKGINEALV